MKNRHNDVARPSPSDLAEMNLIRHGTFMWTKGSASGVVVDRVIALLKEVLTRPETVGERRTIIQALLHDLPCSSITKNLQEDGPDIKFALSQQEIDWLELASERQWVDYMVYRYEFKMNPRTKTLRDFPIYLLIEPTSVCNLRCIMCFQVDSTFTKKEFMGYMSWDLFLKVADQAKEGGTRAITLASRGEPTLHPHFGKMLRHLSHLGFLDLKINTNATGLTESMVHDILAADINEVVFSVDACTKETYEKIRVHGKFESVVDNIDLFNKIRAREYPRSRTVTRISGIKVQDDQDEAQMLDFWSRYVDQITVKRAIERWDSYNNPLVNEERACSVLWERMYVWYDGKVNPCDFDYKSYLCAGDVNTSTIKNIWLGERYQRLRDDHLKKLRHTHTPCDRCPIH